MPKLSITWNTPSPSLLRRESPCCLGNDRFIITLVTIIRLGGRLTDTADITLECEPIECTPKKKKKKSSEVDIFG